MDGRADYQPVGMAVRATKGDENPILSPGATDTRRCAIASSAQYAAEGAGGLKPGVPSGDG